MTTDRGGVNHSADGDQEMETLWTTVDGHGADVGKPCNSVAD